MNKKAIALVAFLAVQAVPAFAQNYHYNYGDSRVVNQNQTGLYTPAATYIGAGTLSRSAQGKNAGVGAALPAVNMGSHVRTAGDNMYNNQGTERMSNGALVYSDDIQRAAAMKQARYRRQQQMNFMRQQQMYRTQAPQGNLYIPGSNGSAATYANQPQQQMNYNKNGAATYGDSGNNSAKARQF